MVILAKNINIFTSLIHIFSITSGTHYARTLSAYTRFMKILWSVTHTICKWEERCTMEASIRTIIWHHHENTLGNKKVKTKDFCQYSGYLHNWIKWNIFIFLLFFHENEQSVLCIIVLIRSCLSRFSCCFHILLEKYSVKPNHIHI